MAKRSRTAADDGTLPDSHLVPHSPTTQKLLLRPSKDTLCDVVIAWLELSLCAPHPPAEDDEDDEEPQLSAQELTEIYEKMRKTGSITKRTVVERIVERDWRRGLNLWQIGYLESRCVIDQSLTFKWTAGRLLLLGQRQDADSILPQFNATSFIHKLQTIIKPMTRTHYHIMKYSELNLVLIRIQLHDATGSIQSYAQMPPTKRVVFCAFPENAPFIFYNAGVKDSLRTILLDSLAQAISRPGQRYELRSTALSAKSLSALVHMRSSSRNAHALGAYSIYADDKVDKSPLDHNPNSPEEADTLEDGQTGEDVARVKRRKIAEGRFGTGAIEDDGRGIEKLEVTVEDKFPGVTGDDAEEEFRPKVTLRFEGTHIFAGIRRMVEEGVIDGVKMPGWMTGEDGVNVAVVRDGKVLKRHDGWY